MGGQGRQQEEAGTRVAKGYCKLSWRGGSLLFSAVKNTVLRGARPRLERPAGKRVTKIPVLGLHVSVFNT